MEILSHYGLFGLFLSAFLAATVLPLSSEIVLGLLVAGGADPFACIGAASAGNILGAVVNYFLGLFGGQFLFFRVLNLQEERILNARQRFEKYGRISLLFAWAPVIGDPLTIAAGIIKVHFGLFVLLVGLGKILRYVVLTWAVISV